MRRHRANYELLAHLGVNKVAGILQTAFPIVYRKTKNKFRISAKFLWNLLDLIGSKRTPLFQGKARRQTRWQDITEINDDPF